MQKQRLTLNIKNKIYNHLMFKGNKSTCEKTIFKTFKSLQKLTKKNHKNLVKLSIINLAPTIDLRQIKKKKRKSIKEFPYVLKSKNRISFGLKNILKKNINNKKLFEKILSSSKKENELLKLNKTNQNFILTKKKYIFFRWFF